MRHFRQQNLSRVQTAYVDPRMINDIGKSREDASNDTIRDATLAPTVPGAIVVEYLLSRVAVALAFVYTGVFLGMYFLSNYFSPATNAASPLSEGLQPGVSLCLIFAAAFLWLWKGATGKALAFATYLFTFVQFLYWIQLTGQIKANTGREVIGTTWISNKLYGAGWFDGFTMIAVLIFVVLSGYCVWQNAKEFFNARRDVEGVPRSIINRADGQRVRN